MAELLLGVNIDHIATLRNARGTAYPDPVQAAFIAEQAGADGITGLDVAGQRDKMRDACKRLAEAGIQVSLFIDADEEQIKAAAEVGAPFIEIHTGCYADAKTDAEQAQELARIAKAATFAASLGLKVNAGHGLTYHNVKAIAAIPEMHELNIGHAIIGRAVMTGLKDAVAEMKRLMLEARG